jgi:hypothetical protein
VIDRSFALVLVVGGVLLAVAGCSTPASSPEDVQKPTEIVGGEVVFGDVGGTDTRCFPDCDGRQCGGDGCGGSCGLCGGAQDLCEDGQCVCQASCEDKECGDDGCEGSCGVCLEGEVCLDGACDEIPCVPQCDGVECGDDSCEGSCGDCAEGWDCKGGICEEPPCVAQCDGLECGDDGCDGSCGECSGNDQCVDGECVCLPACDGLQCGDDGCGGNCGECSGELQSCLDGMCVEGAALGVPCALAADCTADNQCADGYHCNDVAGTCALDVADGGNCVDDADCVAGLFCVDLVCSSVAPEGGDCTSDEGCQEGLHCDAVCTADVVDGGACDEASDCESSNCSASTCCTGGDCCQVDGDCPDPGVPASCDTPATCQGTKTVAQCVDFVCTGTVVGNDSGCDAETTAVECTPFADLFCTGADDQNAPGECATTCATDDECVSGAGCSPAGGCEQVICTLSGNQSDIVDCSLYLARGAVGYNPAVSIQMTLDFNLAQAVPHSLQSCGKMDAPFDAFPCTEGGDECALFENPEVYCNLDSLVCEQCKVVLVGDAGTLVSGHTIETSYQAGGDLIDDEIALLFYGTESQPLNSAYLNNGSVVNDSTLVTVRFQLATNVSEAIPVTINSEKDFSAPDAAATGLPIEVQHLLAPNPSHIIVTGTPQ